MADSERDATRMPNGTPACKKAAGLPPTGQQVCHPPGPDLDKDGNDKRS